MSDVSILVRLRDAFNRLEQWDMRVGDVWLHPSQVEELRKHVEFDRISSFRVERAFVESKGALYKGMLFGARVFESEIVPVNHVGLVSDGWESKLTDRAGCMPF
jgi:hypothetical protein